MNQAEKRISDATLRALRIAYSGCLESLTQGDLSAFGVAAEQAAHELGISTTEPSWWPTLFFELNNLHPGWSRDVLAADFVVIDPSALAEKKPILRPTSNNSPTISILAEIPEELHKALGDFLDQGLLWNQDRVLVAALTLFLKQAEVVSRPPKPKCKARRLSQPLKIIRKLRLWTRTKK